VHQVGFIYKIGKFVAQDFEESCCGLIERGLLSQHLGGENEKYKKNISLAHVQTDN
jgi:hypothetical protein